MATIVESIRNVISIEDDDFFKDDVLLFYANEALKEIHSYLTSTEKQAGVSLRALDSFRKRETIVTTGVTFTSVSDYFTGEIDLPSGISQITFVKYGSATPIKELDSVKLIQTLNSNIVPTLNEGYYNILDISGTKKMELYLHEDGEEDIQMYYLSDVTELVLSDETLTDLPSVFRKAVIYGGAYMAVVQEGVESEADAIESKQLKEEFENQLQRHTY